MIQDKTINIHARTKNTFDFILKCKYVCVYKMTDFEMTHNYIFVVVFNFC